MKSLRRITTLIIALFIFIIFFVVGLSLAKSTLGVAQFVTGVNKWEYEVKEQTTIFYSDKTEMAKIGYKKEYSKDFPELMKKAVVATEDKRFYEHNGLDARGIGRAIWNNLRRGSKSEGGSTITQQLARTLFLGQEKTYSRKIKEVFIATAIEDKYSKDAILNMYLNEIYIGRGCSGMQCAAMTYFGKDVLYLNDAEITTLTGMIQAPEYYRPDDNLEAVKKRQKVVVNNLVNQGFITEVEGLTIMEQAIIVKPYQPAYITKHPYYMAYLTAQLEKEIGAQKLYQGGLKIYTSLDAKMQLAAENALKNNVSNLPYRGITAKDAALVSINPETGEIKAMVGGVDFSRNQLNMAIMPRQPGSAIKPLIYAAAINEGVIKEDSILNNKERSFNNYNPKNFGTNNPETTTVKEALLYSHNIAAIETLALLSVDKAIKYLGSLGITTITPDDKNLALALGGMSQGISPLQMASAYTIFPSGGIYRQHFTIIKIVDEQDKILFSSKLSEKRVIKNKTAEIMDKLLKDVVNYGTATPARIAIPSGGKTGTTTDSKDLWYVGYTSELVNVVWVGNSDATPVSGYSSYGGTVAGPIFKDYMNALINSGALKEAPLFTPQIPEEEAEQIEDDIDEKEFNDDDEENDNELDINENEKVEIDDDIIPLLPPEEPDTTSPIVDTDDVVLPEEVPLIID